jgi:hypothetical protein
MQMNAEKQRLAWSPCQLYQAIHVRRMQRNSAGAVIVMLDAWYDRRRNMSIE